MMDTALMWMFARRIRGKGKTAGDMAVVTPEAAVTMATRCSTLPASKLKSKAVEKG